MPAPTFGRSKYPCASSDCRAARYWICDRGSRPSSGPRCGLPPSPIHAYSATSGCSNTGPGPANGQLQLLTHFNNGYRDGALYLNGTFINGNALFRLAFSGTNRDRLWVMRDNLLVHARPHREPAAVLYALVAALGVLAVGLLVALWPLSRRAAGPAGGAATLDRGTKRR